MTEQIPILILFAHPALQKSRVNKVLAQAVSGLEGVTFHDLYEEYPDFNIDPAREQELLRQHDIIIIQFPFLWYSPPSIVKEWEDIVLEHGWAYGSRGVVLREKKLLCVLSTGGGEAAYRKGSKRFTIRQLLAPLERSAYLCGMEYLPPFAVHGTHLLQDEDIRAHGERYRRLVYALSSGKANYQKLSKLENLNSNLDAVLKD
ncbi:NAD(P)H-dependent oxidoreductase [Fibrobacterota bacterium]